MINFKDLSDIIFLLSIICAYGYYAQNLKGIKFSDLDVCVNVRKPKLAKSVKDNIHYLHVYKNLKDIYLKESCGNLTSLQKEIMFYTSKLDLKPVQKNINKKNTKDTKESCNKKIRLKGFVKIKFLTRALRMFL